MLLVLSLDGTECPWSPCSGLAVVVRKTTRCVCLHLVYTDILNTDPLRSAGYLGVSTAVHKGREISLQIRFWVAGAYYATNVVAGSSVLRSAIFILWVVFIRTAGRNGVES